MGMGWQEWPLMLFTVLGQCVVGGVIVMGLAIIGGNLNEQQRRAVHRAMFFLWLLMGIAFIASTLHLGSPWRAFNSLNRIGASALSNEIAAGALFFAVGGIGQNTAVIGSRVVVGDHGTGPGLCLHDDAGISNRYGANLA